mmetsp:Transcript_5698/g.6590  ORF Transcript_5698/g.6590 Transcript_5698/m.6590 type:complete len:176 (+) Transcript_5698:64-591(+)
MASVSRGNSFRSSASESHVFNGQPESHVFNHQPIAISYHLNGDRSASVALNAHHNSLPLISADNSVEIPPSQYDLGDHDDVIVSPGPADVLFGRGTGVNRFPGNVRFRNIIHESKEEYRDLGLRTQKTQFSENIIDEVHSYGGRFLRRNEGSFDEEWVVADRKKVREKVSQALRE